MVTSFFYHENANKRYSGQLRLCRKCIKYSIKVSNKKNCKAAYSSVKCLEHNKPRTETKKRKRGNKKKVK